MTLDPDLTTGEYTIKDGRKMVDVEPVRSLIMVVEVMI